MYIVGGGSSNYVHCEWWIQEILSYPILLNFQDGSTLFTLFNFKELTSYMISDLSLVLHLHDMIYQT